MWWRLRALAFYTIISVVLVFFFILFWVPMQLPYISYRFRYKVAALFSCSFIYLLWLVCGIKFKIIGKEKLPVDGKPYIALSNHQSFWENFFMQLLIPEHSWVIKKELFDIPLFGLGLRSVSPIAVDRSDNRSVIQILTEGRKKIEAGLSIVIFPEGGTVKIDRSVSFKPSAAKLALDTGVPVVLVVHNSGLFWPKGFWFKRPGTITVKVVEYLSPEKIASYGRDARQLTDYIQERINSEKNALIELEIKE
jgi:1-acyl-sn-glycerol-3-phosphate acyltransferase